MSVLDEAKRAVDARQESYGSPEQNFYRVAQLWTAYLAGRGLIDLDRTDGIMPTDYAWMMALVKIARLEHGYHHDSVVDLAGYAACAAQINEVGNETPSGSETSGLMCNSGATVKGQDVYCNLGPGHNGHHAMYNDDRTDVFARWAQNG